MGRQKIAAALIALGASIASSSGAVAATVAQSDNWAGYEASTSSASGFTAVSATWKQPTIDCSASQGDSAFWVGLGGASSESDALEQAGTEADCNSDGSASYFAWYELLPAAPVKLAMDVTPGDVIHTKVSVHGENVTVTVADETSGVRTQKRLTMVNPDTSTAEWIAEAPSECDGSGQCEPLQLADFGNIGFSAATATAGGHTAPIASWTTQAVELSQGQGEGAVPSGLSGNGLSFSVTTGTVAEPATRYGRWAWGGPGYGYGPPGY